MKEEKPKLELKKRIIANLSNIEMNHVYGGDGDEGGNESKTCNTDEKKREGDRDSVIDKVTNLITTKFPTRVGC